MRSHAADLVRKRIRDGPVTAAAVDGESCVVDDDGRAALGMHARTRRRARDRAGDHHDLSVEAGHARAFSAAAAPARRPKTTHSSSELPIIRLRPCVPPAISPQAYTPSSVVSACVSMTRPPF